MPLNRFLRRDWFAIRDCVVFFFALRRFIVKQAHFYFFSIGFYFLHFSEKKKRQIRFFDRLAHFLKKRL